MGMDELLLLKLYLFTFSQTVLARLLQNTKADLFIVMHEHLRTSQIVSEQYKYRRSIVSVVILRVQSNFNFSNIFGTIKT